MTLPGPPAAMPRVVRGRGLAIASAMVWATVFSVSAPGAAAAAPPESHDLDSLVGQAFSEGIGTVQTELGRLVPSATRLWGLALGLVCAGASLVAWTAYLWKRPDLARVRAGLLLVLLGTTFLEATLCFTGRFSAWAFPILLFLDAWGPLDAVLRFPAVHDIDTLFGLKQAVLLCGKLVLLPFAFRDLLGSLCLLLELTVINFAVLPLMYLLALPLDRSPEEQRRAAKGVEDMDLLLRIGRLASDPRRRSALLRRFERLARTGKGALPQ
mmetsp:Transcript_75959/g.154106  ORF Transcript_75959/g.154106 Transcript_75959/m.154106 type:complete len:269 (+) Transcript_75959:81-887(+)